MLTKKDLESLAEMRIRDAMLLHRAGSFSSAYYLAGYAMEMGLKACIAKMIQPDVIPDKDFVIAIYQHKLESLLNVAGLSVEFKDAMKADVGLAANWAIASKWTEKSRYEMWDSIASATLLSAIADNDHGTFQWVKKHW